MDFLKELPKMTRMLLLLNIALFVLSWVYPSITEHLALHYFESSLFEPYQLLCHVFMHASLMHILFNMYALVTFGSVIEEQLGAPKFLVLYFLSAIGAFVLHMAITWYQLLDLPADVLQMLKTQGAEAMAIQKNFSDPYLGRLNVQFNGAMVGASGAIMGLFMSFVLLFPNSKLQIIFLPFSFKAKYFMPVYMLVELTLGISNFEWDNVAHFAHLGGALFGGLFLLIGGRNPGRY